MLHLLLIGGGEIGAPRNDGTFRPLETFEIDRHFIIGLNKKQPRLLFIPTATEQLDTQRNYERGINSLYGEKLNCRIDTLYLSDNPSMEVMKQKLSSADALYIGGGDTAFMMRRWAETGFDVLLKETARSGKPIAGLSAGAMCWFEKVVLRQNETSFLADGFGLLKNFCLPHWNKKKNMLESPVTESSAFIAIDECAALEINGNTLAVITSKKGADAYICACTPAFREEKIDTINASVLLP